MSSPIAKIFKLLFLLAFLAGLYFTYPFMTLWSISKATQAHDTDTILTYVDWQSIQTNMLTDFTKTFENSKSSQDELPDFGNSFATTAVSNAIKENLTPSNLAKFIRHVKQDSTTRDMSSINGLLHSFMATHVHFTSLTSLQATIAMPGEDEEKPIKMTMRLQDWRWKVTSIQFSEKLTFQFLQLIDTKN